jgi:itaconate CoA-transferase
MYAALGIVLALYQRERTGVGQVVDTSMFESILDWLGYFPHHLWHQGAEPERVGMRHHYIVPYGPYLARDGRYVNIVVGSSRDWERLCRDVLRRPDLLTDPRFADSPKRRERRDVLEPLVEEIIASEDADTWSARLEAARLPHGSVRGMAEVLAHPQVAARRLIREVGSPVGTVPTIESALRLSDSPVAEGPIPGLGDDTDEVLREVSYSPAEIDAFRRAGAIT